MKQWIRRGAALGLALAERSSIGASSALGFVRRN